MTTKQMLSVMGVLVALALVFAWLSSYTRPPAPAAGLPPTSPVLHGTATTTGDFEYQEKADGYQIDIIYPSTTGLGADADLRVRTTIERGLADIINTFKSDAASMLTPDEVARLKSQSTFYALGATYKAYRGQGTVSYEFDIYQDTGGAHPNAFYKTFAFDEQGTVLELSTVLKNNPNWLEELSLLASQDVVRQLKERIGSSLPQGANGPDVTDSMFSEGVAAKEENFQNFVIDGSDLVILIPPYQVAAYAMGTFEVRIPLSKISK